MHEANVSVKLSASSTTASKHKDKRVPSVLPRRGAAAETPRRDIVQHSGEERSPSPWAPPKHKFTFRGWDHGSILSSFERRAWFSQKHRLQLEGAWAHAGVCRGVPRDFCPLSSDWCLAKGASTSRPRLPGKHFLPLRSACEKECTKQREGGRAEPAWATEEFWFYTELKGVCQSSWGD